MKKDRKKGYILEVNVEYPQELLKKHNKLPFLVEREREREREREKIGKMEKLISSRKDKKVYVV